MALDVLKVREAAKGDKLFRVNFGAEVHDRPSFYIWAEPELVTDSVLTLPARATVQTSPNGALILKPSTDAWTVAFVVWSGYRGGSELTLLSPALFQKTFRIFRSPQGRLGISQGALVSTTADRLVVEWRRWGRLYGAPAHGVTVIFTDGTQKDYEGSSVEELLDVGELVL